MKAIILDTDGVIIKSDGKKREVIEGVFKKYGLYDEPGVKEILRSGLNRKILIEKVYDIKKFDKEFLSDDMNKQLTELENNPIGNNVIIDFVKNNVENYLFFINTSLPKEGIDRIVKKLGIGYLFREILTYDNGSKLENINYILEKYDLNPKETLFVDDNINHMGRVKSSGVYCYHYTDYDTDLEDVIKFYK